MVLVVECFSVCVYDQIVPSSSRSNHSHIHIGRVFVSVYTAKESGWESELNLNALSLKILPRKC